MKYRNVTDLQELMGGHCSQGLPQAWPNEQQQEAFETPTPISLEQDRTSDPSPRGWNSR